MIVLRFSLAIRASVPRYIDVLKGHDWPCQSCNLSAVLLKTVYKTGLLVRDLTDEAESP